MFLGNIDVCNGTSTLILTCPVLKEITLANCYWGAGSVEIHVPALDRFNCNNVMGIEFDYPIKIIADRLAVFYSSGSLENFLLSGSTVISATLDNYQDFEDPHSFQIRTGLRVRSILEDISSALEDLRLSIFSVQVSYTLTSLILIITLHKL